MLISGCAIGSEHIIAERYGFRKIYGVEISNVFVSIAKERLSVNKNMFVDYYDGERLPYDDNFFTTVVSGHIIEHTKSPDGYLSEIFRVLSPGGFLFIEFPNRYHTRELHTGAFSFEWLPSFLRSFILKFLSSSISPLSHEKRKIYKIIYETLKPISTWQIKNFLQRFDGGKSRIISKQIPAPGFVRLLIKKYRQ